MLRVSILLTIFALSIHNSFGSYLSQNELIVASFYKDKSHRIMKKFDKDAEKIYNEFKLKLKDTHNQDNIDKLTKRYSKKISKEAKGYFKVWQLTRPTYSIIDILFNVEFDSFIEKYQLDESVEQEIYHLAKKNSRYEERQFHDRIIMRKNSYQSKMKSGAKRKKFKNRFLLFKKVNQSSTNECI